MRATFNGGGLLVFCTAYPWLLAGSSQGGGDLSLGHDGLMISCSVAMLVARPMPAELWQRSKGDLFPAIIDTDS